MGIPQSKKVYQIYLIGAAKLSITVPSITATNAILRKALCWFLCVVIKTLMLSVIMLDA
jgi:hypothetical protein